MNPIDVVIVAILLAAGVGVLGCEGRDLAKEYHFACYTYEDLNEEGTLRRVIEYPCKVSTEQKETIWRKTDEQNHVTNNWR